MTLSQQSQKTITGRFKAFLNRYRVQASTTFGVLAVLTFTAAEVFPKVQQFVFQSGVIQYLTLLIVLDLAVAVYLHQEPAAMRLSKNQDESLPQLIETVPRCRTSCVDLLEYAGATTLPLIRAIRREGVPMRLLVKHPETVSGLQKQRMITTLDTLFNSVFENYDGKFEVRCYRLPFTVRGRLLGNEAIELGWLTPDLKRQTAYGHANPSVFADLKTKSNEYLREFFDRTFDSLWRAEDTEDAKAVLERYQSQI